MKREILEAAKGLAGILFPDARRGRKDRLGKAFEKADFSAISLPMDGQKNQ